MFDLYSLRINVVYRFVETKCGSLATMLMDDELIDRSVVPKIGHLINMREKLAFLVRVLYDIKDETVESLVVSCPFLMTGLE